MQPRTAAISYGRDRAPNSSPFDICALGIGTILPFPNCPTASYAKLQQ